MTTTANAALYYWDGDVGGDNFFLIENPNESKSYWNNMFGAGFSSWVNDPSTLPGLDDTVVFATAYASGNNINLRGDRAAYELWITDGAPSVLNFNHGGVASGSSSLSIENGRIQFRQEIFAKTLNFWNVPVIFRHFGSVEALQTDRYMGYLRFDAGIFAPEGMRIGPGIYAQITSPLISPSLSIEGGTVMFGIGNDDGTADGTFIGNTIVVGDNVGNVESATMQFNSTIAPFTNRTVQIKADGVVWLKDDSGVNAYDLEGGRINLFGRNSKSERLQFTSIKASPGLLAGTSQPNAALIEPYLDGETPTYLDGVDLRGENTTFDMRSAHGMSDALRVRVRVHNGSINKIGDGTLVLEGLDGQHEFHSATIAEGAIAMTRPWVAPAFISPTLQIGDGSGGIGAFENRANNLIDSRAAVTILSDGILKTRTHSESVTNVTLRGGSIDTRYTVFGQTSVGRITLNSSVSVDGSQQSSIYGNATLAGDSVTVNIADNAPATDLLIDATLIGGRLVQNGAGTTRLVGTTYHTFFDVNNSHAGTEVLGGTLELAKPSGASAVGSDLIVGTTDQATGGPTLRWITSNQIPDNLIVKFRSGLLDLNGNSDTIRGINSFGTGGMTANTAGGVLGLTGGNTAFAGARANIHGKIDLTGGVREFNARGNSSSDPNFTNWTFTGQINNGTFQKTGVGRVEFNGVTGNTLLNVVEGTARINASSTFSGLSGGGTVELTSTLTLNTIGITTFTGLLSSPSGLLTPGSLAIRGSGELVLTGANTFLGSTTVSGGATLTLQNTTGSAIGHGSVRIEGGTLAGTGRIAPGSLAINAVTLTDGAISPGGDAPGTFSFAFGQSTAGPQQFLLNGGKLRFDLGTSSDLINFTTTDNWLRGTGTTLEIIPGDGFHPDAAYTLFGHVKNSGANFAFADIAGSPAGYEPIVFYDAPTSSYMLRFNSTLAGDLNRDGKVDAVDYVVWRKGLGTTFTQTDYNTWRANFGRVAGSGATAHQSPSVPEPASSLLVLFFIAAVWLLRTRTLGKQISGLSRIRSFASHN